MAIRTAAWIRLGVLAKDMGCKAATAAVHDADAHAVAAISAELRQQGKFVFPAKTIAFWTAYRLALQVIII